MIRSCANQLALAFHIVGWSGSLQPWPGSQRFLSSSLPHSLLAYRRKAPIPSSKLPQLKLPSLNRQSLIRIKTHPFEICMAADESRRSNDHCRSTRYLERHTLSAGHLQFRSKHHLPSMCQRLRVATSECQVDGATRSTPNRMSTRLVVDLIGRSSRLTRDPPLCCSYLRTILLLILDASSLFLRRWSSNIWSFHAHAHPLSSLWTYWS